MFLSFLKSKYKQKITLFTPNNKNGIGVTGVISDLRFALI
jgi:hypothetical protein